jgi:polysaccharide biosynthesis protein PslG
VRAGGPQLQALTVRSLLAVAAALAALLVAVPGVAAQRTVPQGFFGVMYDNGIEKAPDHVQDPQWDLMASSGVETVRTVFNWAEAQPDGRGSPFEFERTDGVVRRAALRNLDVLPIVFYSPRWARAYRNRFTSPPKSRSDYVTYLAALVERYGPEGTYWTEHPELPKHPLREWQIWNEPHLPAYWDAPEDGPYGYARNYPRLLRDSYNIVKSLDPGAKIVMAGITQRAWEEIEVLYQRGIKGYFDVAALQIFPQTVKRAVKATRFYRDAMRRRGDGRKPIYLTEITWPASKGRTQGIKYQLQETPQGMATKLSQMYSAMVARRSALGVGKVFWYTWSSPYGRGGSIFNYAGLQRYDNDGFQAQPALGAYQRSARRFQGCTKTVTGVCQ